MIAKSFICLRWSTPLWSPAHEDHDRILTENRIKDKKLIGRNHVRVWMKPIMKWSQLSPMDINQFTFHYHGDVPGWFDPEKEKMKCFEIIVEKILPHYKKTGKFLGKLDVKPRKLREKR